MQRDSGGADWQVDPGWAVAEAQGERSQQAGEAAEARRGEADRLSPAAWEAGGKRSDAEQGGEDRD
jgi:hypothetical protein